LFVVPFFLSGCADSFLFCRVVCPLALVGQWSDEIQKMAKGLTVVQHQGTARASGRHHLAFTRYKHNLTSYQLDPKNLRRAHVVVTTYDVVKSEYESYNPSAKDESKSKSKSKKKAPVDSSDDELDSSDSADHFGRTVASKKAAKAKAGKKKDALYQLKWWRIVLGILIFHFYCLGSLN
jgi:SNF2 family DNA or RNA helicase